ncbi:MAG: hypothetical protein CRN43_21455 [Candidatus Nephrothrix sp. EaCA]|nr:MAG: hypothetical protein CRN43_21455 [Candidatus Nephrothrix sp. EaCA]
MKTLCNLLIAVLLMPFSACQKEEDRVTLKGGTNPVLTVSSMADLTLNKNKAAHRALQFQWTNPNYEFSHGRSTQDVKYTLQIDTVDAFSSSRKYETSFSNSLSAEYSVKDLNSMLGVLDLKDGVPHLFNFRIKASLGAANAAPLYSNALAIRIAPYTDALYPVPDKLYIVGGATPHGWGNDSGLEKAQQFAKINAYTFVINIALTSDGYLFVPVAGSWDAKYGFAGEKGKNNTAGDSFKPGGEDFQGPAAGNYKITVNFKTGKFLLEKI